MRRACEEPEGAPTVGDVAGTEHRKCSSYLSRLAHGQSLRDRGERVDRPGSDDEGDVSPRLSP